MKYFYLIFSLYSLWLLGLPVHYVMVASASAPLVGKHSLANHNSSATPLKTAFVHAQNRHLMVNGKPIVLKGINFSNNYEQDLTSLDLLNSTHHSEHDYQRVKNLGFNSIRFAFNGNWYEQKPKDFWTWLDHNIALAKRHQLYLILDMHVPIGGYWLNTASEKLDFRIWSDPHIQQRNLALWQAIAQRYKNETVIAAYDILNEPVTTDDTGEQWQQLAQALVDVIRSVDQNHLIIVGRVYGTHQSYQAKIAKKQFLVNDDNVMYDFHFYEPIIYTHQYASWITSPLGDGGRYPDANRLIPTGEQVLLATTSDKSPNIVNGNSDWTEYSSELIKITDPKIKAAFPTLVVRGAMQGQVYFDDFSVTEYDESGHFVQEVINEPLSAQTIWQWWDWIKPTNQTPLTTFVRLVNDGFNDAFSLSIANVYGSKSTAGWSSDTVWFQTKLGYQYRIKGHMKGTNVQLNHPSGHVGFELDLYGAKAGNKNSFMVRDKNYLRHEFMKFFLFGIDHDVPMSVMEFGLMRQCFEQRAKGGRQWVADMLDIFREHATSFAYWNYHGNHMGLYLTSNRTPPGQPNLPLLTILKQKLTQWPDMR